MQLKLLNLITYLARAYRTVNGCSRHWSSILACTFIHFSQSNFKLPESSDLTELSPMPNADPDPHNERIIFAHLGVGWSHGHSTAFTYGLSLHCAPPDGGITSWRRRCSSRPPAPGPAPPRTPEPAQPAAGPAASPSGLSARPPSSEQHWVISAITHTYKGRKEKSVTCALQH